MHREVREAAHDDRARHDERDAQPPPAGLADDLDAALTDPRIDHRPRGPQIRGGEILGREVVDRRRPDRVVLDRCLVGFVLDPYLVRTELPRVARIGRIVRRRHIARRADRSRTILGGNGHDASALVHAPERGSKPTRCSSGSSRTPVAS